MLPIKTAHSTTMADATTNSVDSTAHALLDVQDFSLSIHDRPILNRLSFSLGAGRTLGVIGESGSGKSMTALSIMRLLPRGAELRGSIRFENKQILDAEHPASSLSESAMCNLRGGDIGMIFQEPMTALNPVKTIGDQVAESVMIHTGMSRHAALRQAAEVLEQVELPNSAFPLSRYPHELSGGQRQRVVIAIAVACGPRLLIADEPTTALDVTTQASILNLLQRLQRDSDMALMLITHDLALVADMADDIIIMREGHILERGDRNQVFTNPQHDYTKILFKASAMNENTLPADISSADSIVRKTLENVTSNCGRSDKPLLEVDFLSVDYPIKRQGLFQPPRSFRAVNNISFELYPGENLGLVGESGCGKSTLSRALLGLLPISQGTVRLSGEPVSKDGRITRTARRDMQIVFQDPYGSFNPRHRVRRLVAEPLHLLHEPPTKAKQQRLVAESLEQVGLAASDANRFIHEFSGGQRQRIAIARALILHPKLIILDEAVSALDVSVRAQVLRLLRLLGESKGLSYLFISHDLSVVEKVTDRVLVMKDGEFVERGATHEVFVAPQHAYTRELVDAVPRLPETILLD